MEEMSASEAVFGFIAWLTARPEEVVLSADHDAVEAANLGDKFCKVNSLVEPREGWTARLTHPSS